MPETAINAPFDASEIIEIATQELEKRLRGLSPLQGAKEYTAFSLDFQVKIRLRRAGETPQDARKTLAWGRVSLPSAADLDVTAEEEEIRNSTYQSKDPNEERIERDMPLTVESADGRGGRKRRKVRVKGA